MSIIMTVLSLMEIPQDADTLMFEGEGALRGTNHFVLHTCLPTNSWAVSQELTWLQILQVDKIGCSGGEGEGCQSEHSLVGKGTSQACCQSSC